MIIRALAFGLLLSSAVAALAANNIVAQDVYTTSNGSGAIQVDPIAINVVYHTTGQACSGVQGMNGAWTKTGNGAAGSGTNTPSGSFTPTGTTPNCTGTSTMGASTNWRAGTSTPNTTGATDVKTVNYINDNNSFGNHYFGSFSIVTTERRTAQPSDWPAPTTRTLVLDYYIQDTTPPPSYSFLLNITSGCGTLSGDPPQLNGTGVKTYQLQIQGVVVYTQTATGSGNPRIPTFSHLAYIYQPSVNGAAWAWLEDGAPIASGTVTNAEGAGSVNTRVICTSSAAPSPTPAITPKPTPTATVAPSPMPTTTPGPTAPTTTPFPTPPPAATPVVMSNMEDFYNAVKRALNDAGNGKTADFASDPYTNNADPTPPPFEADANEAIKQAGQIMDKFKNAGVSAKVSFNSLPKSLGSECTVILPTAWAFGTDTTVNFCDWASEIALLRLLVLWLVTVSMAFLYLGALTYTYD